MDKTIGRLEDFFPQGEVSYPIPPFKPSARYYAPMDYIMYVEEDIACRADRVDKFLTLLWHPYEERAIGVKIKGVRFLFERMRQILASHSISIDADAFVPLITVFEVAVTAAGPAITASVERTRIDAKYAEARRLVQRVNIDTSELLKAA